MAIDYETAKQVINQYISEVNAVMPVDKVYLYGSYANGTAKWDSDIDLCFFSNSFAEDNMLNILEELFRLKRHYNKYFCLEPNAFPLAELKNDNPFVKEILRTGTEIYSR